MVVACTMFGFYSLFRRGSIAGGKQYSVKTPKMQQEKRTGTARFSAVVYWEMIK